MLNANEIKWADEFDAIYCIHYLPQTRKLPRLMSELERVGIAQSGVLKMRYTSASRYDGILFRYANEMKCAINVGCINLGLEALHMLNEAISLGHKRILVLENDVAFLKNLDEISATLNAMPEDADIWQMDNFVVPNGEAQYQWLRDNRREGNRFFNASGAIFYSGACFALSRTGMKSMYDILSGALQPPDSCFALMERMGCKRVVADTNLAIQLVYAGSVSADLWGIRSHHDGYARGGVDYSLYNVPEGYAMPESAL